MSNVTVYNNTRTVRVTSTGQQGPAGLIWIEGGWVEGQTYDVGHAIEHNSSSYRATVQHVATTANEPGRGPAWEAVWAIVAQGFDPSAPLPSVRTTTDGRTRRDAIGRGREAIPTEINIFPLLKDVS